MKKLKQILLLVLIIAAISCSKDIEPAPIKENAKQIISFRFGGINNLIVLITE